MASPASPFIIRELTGDKREFRLAGRALPYPPFTLSGKQRNSLTWYAGSPEGTIQMLGAEEEQTTINGKWKDRFLRRVEDLSPDEQRAAGFDRAARGVAGTSEPAAGQYGEPGAQINGQPINNIRELAEEFDDVRRKGQILEVSWVNQVRQGILERFRQSWFVAQEVEWEMTFTWINQGTQLADIPIQERSLDLSDFAVEAQAQLDILRELQDGAIPLNGAVDDLQAVNQRIDQVQQAVLQFQDAIIVNAQAILDPLRTAQRAVGILDFIQTTAEETADAIESRLDSAVLNIEETFGIKLDQRGQLITQKQAALSISNTSAIRKEQVKKQLNPELVSSFVARDNTDLRDVALQFYGVADEWRSLLDFNNLDTSRLSANQVIFVPRNPPNSNQC